MRNSCADSIVREFDSVWNRDFSRYPGMRSLSERLRTDLTQDPSLSPDLQEYFRQGGSPLTLGQSALLEGLRSALAKVVENSDLSKAKKTALFESLNQAVQSLIKEPIQIDDVFLPGNGGGNGGGGSWSGGPSGNGGRGDAQDYAARFSRYLKGEGVARCATRGSILFVASSVINTATALQAKWERYAGKNAPAVKGILNPSTWNKAWQDEGFRRNMFFNGILMSTIAAFSCIPNRTLGKRLIVATTAGVSALGQYLASGKIEISQILFDVFYVRFVSLNKTQFVFRLAEKYRASGWPVAWLAEGGLQLLSEGVGGALYSRTSEMPRRVANYLMGNTPETMAPPATN